MIAMKRVFVFLLLAVLIGSIAAPALAAWSERTVYVKFFSQINNGWKDDPVGTTGCKMSGSGCVVTGVAQVLTYYYINTDPGQFVDWLNSNRGFDGCLLKWGKITTYSEKMGRKVAYGGPYSKTSYDTWAIARNEVLSGRPVLIEKNPNNGHWLVGRGYENGKFTINDPLKENFALEQFSGTIYRVVTFSLQTNPGLDPIFNECRDRNGTSNVGNPVTGYYTWGSLIVKEFQGGFGRSMMTYLYPNAGVRKCYLIRRGFKQKWDQLGGPYSYLGMPITDEYPSFKYKDANGNKRARQDYADGGYMVWYGDHVKIYNWKGQLISGSVSAQVEVPKPITVTATGIEAIHPNPFNPQTVVSFTLAEQGQIKLAVYDINGRLVTVLADGNYQVGQHQVVWKGEDSHGQSVASGVYFVRLQTATAVSTRKAVLLK